MPVVEINGAMFRRVEGEACGECGRWPGFYHAVTCSQDPASKGRCSRCKGPRTWKNQGYCSACLAAWRAGHFANQEKRDQKRAIDREYKRRKTVKAVAATLGRLQGAS